MAVNAFETSLDTASEVARVSEHFATASAVVANERDRRTAEDFERMETEISKRFDQPSLRFQLTLKRLIDIIGSSVLIILLAPVLVLAALAIKLTSRGPIMFTQKRWGLNQEHFTCLKFRSMITDQSKFTELNEFQQMEKEGILFKIERDPRVTAVGRIIRKTSVDELPQLFNVLKGDMSLVGPRPLALHMMEPYPSLRAVRCLARPGISGLWQVRERENNVSVMGMIEHDTEYLRRYSLWLDIKILLSTPAVVLFGAGAC